MIAAAPIASALFGAGSFTYGVVNGQQRLAELQAISSKLDALDRKLNSVASDVKSLQVGQEWLEGATLYGKDVQRIMYLTDFLTQRLTLQTNKALAPTSLASEWADNVLDLGEDGIGQVNFCCECF